MAQQTETKQRQRAISARLFGPVGGALRTASALSVLAGALWPFQAAILAWIVSGWATGGVGLTQTLAGAGAFLLAALLRALLEHRAGGILFRAAETVISGERATLLRREARARAPVGSAAVAALVVQKLPLLRPWITRYRVAMARVAVLPLLYLALALWFSWAVALILLAAGPLIPVFMALVGMAAEDASRRQLDEISDMNDMLMDRLSASLDIRLLGASARAADDFATRAEGLRARTMAVLRIAFLSSTVLELFAAIGVAMVAVFVGFTLLGELRFGTWGAPLTLGPGLFLLLIVPEFFQPMRDLSAVWHDRASGLSVLSELDEMERAPRLELLGTGRAVAPLPGPLRVEVRGAAVALPGRLPLRLPDLTLRAGEAVAVSGPSGAGKSTALAAIAALLPLQSGAIHVCGEVLNGTTADAWRARLAMIPQAVHFADLTLAEFLDPRATGADPWPALDLAAARHIVERLPDGLRTRLGESGGGVSGGEARRLMIARAVMAGGDLLLADEPTADLDPRTAAQVIAALAALKAQGKTMIVATHDPNLIAAMDREIEVPR